MVWLLRPCSTIYKPTYLLVSHSSPLHHFHHVRYPAKVSRVLRDCSCYTSWNQVPTDHLAPCLPLTSWLPPAITSAWWPVCQSSQVRQLHAGLKLGFTAVKWKINSETKALTNSVASLLCVRHGDRNNHWRHWIAQSKALLNHIRHRNAYDVTCQPTLEFDWSIAKYSTCDQKLTDSQLLPALRCAALHVYMRCNFCYR